MRRSKFLILGGGMVAGYAAKEMVERGLRPGDLSIVSADTAAPYERPPLSKGFLAGKDDESQIRINPESFYREHAIELDLGAEVSGVDTGRKVLTLRLGPEIGFEKLIVATGAAVKTLDVPGSDLSGVSFSVWWLRQQRLVAAFTLNRPDQERDAAPRWIESQQPISPEDLRDGGWPGG